MIELIGVGDEIRLETLDSLAAGVARVFRDSCHVREDRVDSSFAFDPVRKQYHATALLRFLAGMAPRGRLLGVAGVDLYVPIFTFVFGEAQLAGPCGVVSAHRLREEFYGLPGRPELLESRLLKESVHELGHTFGLRHCPDWQCAMTASHTVDRLDLKAPALCPKCRKAAFNGS